MKHDVVIEDWEGDGAIRLPTTFCRKWASTLGTRFTSLRIRGYNPLSGAE